MSNNLKHAVITGSAIGIGRALAEHLTNQGWAVYGIDRDPQEPLDHLVPLQCDIGDADAVQAVFRQIAAHTDTLDLLVNNAGLWNNTTLTGGDFQTQFAAFKAAMDATLMGSYACTLAAVPMLEKSVAPNVINMITEHVFDGHYITGMVATGYDCAKFGLWRLNDSWAVELKDRGIRVNALCFGATDTPMLRGVAPQVAETAMKGEDIARAVVNVVKQGPSGDTGQRYLFGTTGQPREKSLPQIEALKSAVS